MKFVEYSMDSTIIEENNDVEDKSSSPVSLTLLSLLNYSSFKFHGDFCIFKQNYVFINILEYFFKK